MHINRTLLFIFCILMLQISYATDTTSVASGGNARMLALGGSPVNHYIEDYTDIFINPAYMERYPRLAMIELGNGFGSGSGYSANNQNLGITCPLGKTTLGLAIGKREGPMFAENSYGYQNGGAFTACDYMKYALDIYLQNIAVQASSEPLTPIQLLGAFKLENGSAGVALYYANWSRDDNGTGSVSSGRTCSASLSQYGIKLGFLHTLDSCTVLDLSGCFRLNKASVDYSNRNAGAPLTASSFSANGYEMLATIRFFYKLADGISLIPLARAGVFSYEPEISSSPLSNYLLPLPNSYWNLECELGLGIQSLWEHGLGAVGVSFRYISLKNDAVSSTGSAQQTTQYKRTWLDLPKINAGIELYITDWLAGRAGFSKRISSQSTYVESSSSPPTESTITTEPGFLPSYGLNAADQTLSLGLGIVLDKFAFNAYLAEQVLGTGSYLLSGIEQSLFGLVSISYQY